MANITAALVKELRERTNAGMMDCKKALVESDGDMDKAIDWLREKGLAQAAKKAGRIAAEGAVVAYMTPCGCTGALVEVNCETDFVANTDNFKNFANAVAKHVALANPADLDELMKQKFVDAYKKYFVIWSHRVTLLSRLNYVIPSSFEHPVHNSLSQIIILKTFCKDILSPQMIHFSHTEQKGQF